jgi:hypothetical protein
MVSQSYSAERGSASITEPSAVAPDAGDLYRTERGSAGCRGPLQSRARDLAVIGLFALPRCLLRLMLTPASGATALGSVVTPAVVDLDRKERKQ